MVARMSEHPTYTAVCERSGSWWAVSVPELRGVHTQARRLDQAETMAREAIALLLEFPEDSFTVVVEQRAKPTRRGRRPGKLPYRRLPHWWAKG